MMGILRQQRMLMVQTVGQYTFVYKALIQSLKNTRLIWSSTTTPHSTLYIILKGWSDLADKDEFFQITPLYVINVIYGSQYKRHQKLGPPHHQVLTKPFRCSLAHVSLHGHTFHLVCSVPECHRLSCCKLNILAEVYQMLVRIFHVLNLWGSFQRNERSSTLLDRLYSFIKLYSEVNNLYSFMYRLLLLKLCIQTKCSVLSCIKFVFS